MTTNIVRQVELTHKWSC